MNKIRSCVLLILKGFAVLAAVLIGITGCWILFSVLHTADPLDVIPADFAIYARTDNAWDSINPLLDMQATEVLLSDPGLGAVKESVVQFKQSGLRSNPYIRFAASRRIDAAVYTAAAENPNDAGAGTETGRTGNSGKRIAPSDIHFAAVIDMGLLSAATRLAPFAAGFINIPELHYIKSGNFACYEYKSETKTLYAGVHRNLVVAADSEEMLRKMMTGNNAQPRVNGYAEKNIRFLKTALKDPFRIIFNIKNIPAIEAGKTVNAIKEQLTPLIDTTDFAEISFGITAQDISFSVSLPLMPEDVIEAAAADNPAARILDESDTPDLLAGMPDYVQYFTTLNAGSIEDLKDIYRQFAPAEQDFDSLWNTAQNLCRLGFSLSLEDLLFSWIGRELSVWGLENKKDPVFIIEIKDEEKRAAVFNSLFSSIILNENTSLLLNGVRVPRIELPAFLQSLVHALGISMIRPYYLVNGNYIYFSQSAENLITITAAAETSARLTATEHWKRISSTQSSASAFCLYYNLERSIPFFLRSNSAVSQMLKLYTNGRADVRIRNNMLQFCLQATTAKTPSVLTVPGYPRPAGTASEQQLHTSGGRKQLVFYVSDKTKITALNPLQNREIHIDTQKELNILPAAEPVKPKGAAAAGTLWAWDKSGNVYLYSDSLELLPPFPVSTGIAPSSEPTAYKESLLLPLSNGMICRINGDGSFSGLPVNHNGSIRSPLTVLDNTAALYSKRLKGSVIIFDITGKVPQTSIDVTGIGYGSPALLKRNNSLIIGFVTHSGLFYAWNSSGTPLEGFPVQLNGVFLSNVKSAGKYFYALSSEGTLFRTALDGSILSVALPHSVTAKNGTLCITDYDDDHIDDLFVSGDENMLYGFTEDLELIPGFPVAGRGYPVFADLNGNGKNECLVRSVNGMINGWKLR